MATQQPIQEVICGYTVHPAASELPLLRGKDLNELVESIRERGQQVPAILDDQGRILDGRNRARAIELLREQGFDIELIATPYSGSEHPAMAVSALNIARRHLTADQRAMYATKFLEMYEADANTAKESSKFDSAKASTAAKTRHAARSKTTEPQKRDYKAEAERTTAVKVAKSANVSTYKAKKSIAARKAEAEGLIPAGSCDEAIRDKTKGIPQVPSKKAAKKAKASKATSAKATKATKVRPPAKDAAFEDADDFRHLCDRWMDHDIDSFCEELAVWTERAASRK